MNLKLYSAKLNDLMDNMQIYYARNRNELLVPYIALKNGLYITCIYSNEYHRARIVDASQKSESILKVYFFDYGTIAVVNIQGVCYLHKQFADLPEQAIRGRLAGICPSTENEQWSRSASARFLSLVMQKDLLAQLIRIDEEQRILDIVLADTSEEDEDFFINDALVAMDYAIFTFQTRKPAEKTDIVPIVRYIHLYPTHYELENGLVPTALQMIIMHQAGLVIEQIYPHYFKDAKTNLPISSKNMVTKTNLPVDYSNERPYYEENQNNQCYDEAIGGNNPVCESEASATSESLASPSVTLKCRWEDIIEEVELNSATINDDINDVSLQTPKKDCVSAESEKIDDSNSAVSENNGNTDKESSQSPATDSTLKTVANDTNGYAQINNNTNNEAKTKVYQTNNYTQINVASKITNDNTDIKKPLRPPPGYNNITPQTTNNCNYPYIPTPTPNNYIANQTYINFPVHSPAFMVPYYYNCAHPYQYNDTYSSVNNILQNIQYLIKCGYTLTPEQQKFLQSLNWSELNPHPHQNSYGVQMQFPYGNGPPPAYPGASPPTQNLQKTDANSSNLQMSSQDNTVVEEPSNKSVRNPVAATFIPDRAVTDTSSTCVDECIQVDEEFLVKEEKSVGTDCADLPAKDDGVVPPAEVDNDDKVTVSTDKPSDIPDNNVTLTVTNESQNNTIKEVKNESNKMLSTEVNNVQQSETKKTWNVTDIYNVKPQGIKETIISNNNDIEDAESIYEDCESNGILSDSCGPKLITSISIGELNVHIVSLENEYYFLLSELSKKIFSKSLTALQIRKLFVATPCAISVVDIWLKRNPELKKELLMYDLIKEDELTVDAVPIKYFKELAKIIPMPGNVVKVTNLLEEIDCFLCERNLESVY